MGKELYNSASQLYNSGPRSSCSGEVHASGTVLLNHRETAFVTLPAEIRGVGGQIFKCSAPEFQRRVAAIQTLKQAARFLCCSAFCLLGYRQN